MISFAYMHHKCITASVSLILSHDCFMNIDSLVQDFFHDYDYISSCKFIRKLTKVTSSYMQSNTKLQHDNKSQETWTLWHIQVINSLSSVYQRKSWGKVRCWTDECCFLMVFMIRALKNWACNLLCDMIWWRYLNYKIVIRILKTAHNEQFEFHCIHSFIKTIYSLCSIHI